MFLGSTTFLGRFVDDPFLAPADPIAVATLSRFSPVATFTVPFEATQLWLSPTGRYVALSSEDEQERMTIHAGPAGGSLTAFEADEAVFVDEGRLLLLERQRTGAVLRVVNLERGSREIWSRPVALRAGSVSIDRSSNRWQLLGWNDAGDIVSVTGRIGEDATSEERWKSPGMAIQLQPFAVSDRNVLAIETRSSSSRFTRALGPWAPLIRPATGTESRLWTVGPESRFPFAMSHFVLDCRNTSLDEPATCTAFDGMTTRFFALDSTTRRLTALASMTGRFYVRGVAGCGWLAGWWDHALVLVRPSTREAIRVPEDGRRGRGPDELAMADKMIGAVFSEPHGSTVQLFSIEPPD
jgi:hypothetical protein